MGPCIFGFPMVES